MAEISVSTLNGDVNTTVVPNRSDIDNIDSSIRAVRDVITYLVPALGIPGNVLSAIVWLRRGVAGNSSSAVYLAAIAVNDLIFLTAYSQFNIM